MSQAVRGSPVSTASVNLRRLKSHDFGHVAEPYRRELQAHCYRLLGSTLDAEDLVQETLLRAWQRRATYQGRASFRAWLYKIATNLCLDALARRPRRLLPVAREAASRADAPIPPSVNEPIWLEPFPEDVLAPDAMGPEAQVAAHEHISLAFITALQWLPPRQRAVLILRDVLEWEASEVADVLNMTVAAVKSALHRARATLTAHARADAPKAIRPKASDKAMQARLARYVRAWEAGDANALVNLLTHDATFSMPPIPSWYQGRKEICALVRKTIFGGDAHGRWRLVRTCANGQVAFGLYQRDAQSGQYQAYGIQVLTLAGKAIADITTFRNPALVAHFKLPLGLKA